ncbi:MAG: hypothetical protein QT00_C0001G0488 [archaeon GW2011_AR5]|nr:MAG: hypothetical protein QT00_C0001G0488 [archaeon GW2011_AR5]
MDFVNLIYVDKKMVMRKTTPMTDSDINAISKTYDAELVRGPWGVNEYRVYNFETRRTVKTSSKNQEPRT